uniref:PiggyBac transposable element-derived protein domain-containing protein n=1 Tax=Romanomermis culicivorax TaxID=13658 RepID=A0A915LCE2_ROMCU
GKIFHPRTEFFWCETVKFTLVKYEKSKNKFIYLLSSKHDSPNILSSGLAAKPEIFSIHNGMIKCGVVDKLIERWTSSTLTTRWPLRIFYWLLDVVYLNAYILYCESNTSKNKYNMEHSGRMQFLTDSSLAFLSQKINHRASDPRMKSNPFFRKLVDVVQGFAKLAVGRKKENILSNIPVENRTPLKAGRLLSSKSSSYSAAASAAIDADDQPSTSKSIAAVLEFKPPSTLEVAAAQIERNRLRKACRMEECRGRSRKTSYKCHTCKKPLCKQCIKRKSRNCVFCKNCSNL